MISDPIHNSWLAVISGVDIIKCITRYVFVGLISTGSSNIIVRTRFKGPVK